MAVATAFQHILSNFKLRGIDVEATTTAAYAGWEDMKGYKYFAAMALNASSTGAINAFSIYSGATSTGSGAVAIKSSTTTTADAIDDYIVLELDAAEINSTDVDGRWVSAQVQGTTNQHVSVFYVKGGGPCFVNQTADYIST